MIKKNLQMNVFIYYCYYLLTIRDQLTKKKNPYLVQCQHVEVADVILLGVSDPGPTLLLVNHLSHVLADKLTLTGGIGKRKDSFVHLIRFEKEIVSH